MSATDKPINMDQEEMDPNIDVPQKNKRKYVRKTAKESIKDEDSTNTDDESVASAPKPPKRRVKGSPKTTPKAKNSKTRKESASTKVTTDVGEKATPSPKAKSKKATSSKHQQITERVELPKLWSPDSSSGSYTYRIASWNVAGLRALMRKNPTALADLCKEHNLDMLCLQETKLQEMHLDDPKLKIRGHLLVEEGYEAHYNCCTAKKGYSGTVTFFKQHTDGTKKSKQKTIDSFFSKGKKKESVKEEGASELSVDTKKLTPEDISFGIGNNIDNEGRVVVVDLPFGSIVNVYVPNSGQKLERLDYRTTEWDKQLLEFMQQKQKKRCLPVMWVGDLNVAHTHMDVWNDGASHLAKQAGVTEVERKSFQDQLDSGFYDAFRKLHPETTGQYSYWSQRAGNRTPNKGLRLDYFICSSDFFSEDSPAVVRDSYIIPHCPGSDHCPVVLELEVKGP